MNRVAGALLLICASTLSAQELPQPPPADQEEVNQAVTDSLPPPEQSQPPADVPTQGVSVSPFYHPPVIREVFSRYYQLVDTLDDQVLTRRFIQALLDSLAKSVQADFDSLVERARAFETREEGYTHRFYLSPLTRDEILGEPISEQEASNMPHFHAIYDPQGYLLRVRYVEPRRWRARQQLLAMGTFQSETGSPPLVRYFRAWDVRHLEPVSYIRKDKVPEDEPYLRVIYDQQDRIQSVQQWDDRGGLVYTVIYDQAAADSGTYARLEFSGDSTGSLLTIHPYLYLRDWSIVKAGWKVAFTRDGNGSLASTQVFTKLNQLSYYYTFSLRSDPESDKRTLRGTVISDTGKIERVFALGYDIKDQLVRRSFYTIEGELQETTTYDYHRRSSELVVTTRNAAGIVTSRQKYINPSFWN
ncbi:MAG: hypothetical protein JSU77_01140 [Fidelibacterota bacterium]|nr:MAG: hypothetical protein JSU77_01140 [Candidatus Neomarinimicrobiota bacterium]